MNAVLTAATAPSGANQQPWSFVVVGDPAVKDRIRQAAEREEDLLYSLTHAPSPMGFLEDILGRPENERPFLLLPVGYPAEGASVPTLDKKPLEDIATFI